MDMKRKVTVILAVMFALLFAALNQTIVGTALPRIVADLGGMEIFHWVFTAFMLASTASTILVGKLSDIYGRKPFILIGLIVFISGTFLCGLSQTMIQLILYRMIQGFGAGVIISSAFASVGDLFAPRERGRWQGLMGGAFGVASVFGPTLGGYIVDHYHWHWVFWVFLPLGVIALALIWMLFPSVERAERQPIDYMGSLLLVSCLVPLLLAFSWAGSRYAWGSATIIGLFIVSAVSLVLFIVAERKAKSPVLPLSLFRKSVFTISNAIGFMIGAGMFGTVIYAPFFIQGVMGTSPSASGFVMMPLTLSLVLSGALIGNWITRTGKYKMYAQCGLLIMAVGMLLLALMDTGTSNLEVAFYLILAGFGLGIGFTVYMLTVQNVVEDRMLGVATASVQLFRQIGGTIGVSVLGTVMNVRMSERIREMASPGGPMADLPPEAEEAFAGLRDPQTLMDPERMEAIGDQVPDGLHELFEQTVLMMREALSDALTAVFLLGAIVAFGAFVLGFFLKELPLRTRRTVQREQEPASPKEQSVPGN